MAKASQAGDYDLFLMSRFGSNANYSINALDGRHKGPASENFTMLDAPEIYSLLDTAYGSINLAAGKDAFHQLDVWNAKNFATLPLIDQVSLFGAKDYLDGLYLDYNGMHAVYGMLYKK
jgi:ABC-type transport system substrate-binding protein